MKSYKVNVNGTEYEVTVEEMKAGEQKSAPQPKPATVAAAPAAAGSATVTCPMPGTLTQVLVKTGDPVKKGQVLVILEAMKMENEIMAPCDGKVLSVSAVQGASAATGDTLVVIG